MTNLFSQTYLIRRVDDYNSNSTIETARYVGNIQAKMQAKYDANHQKISNEINNIKQQINDLPFDYNTRKNISTRFTHECLKSIQNSGINMTSNSDVTNAINYMYNTVNNYIDEVRIGKIGIRFDEENNNFIITEIIYGSPAWRGNQLNVGDVILKVGEYGGNLINVRGMDFEEVYNLVTGEKDTKVTLVVKKSYGTISEISITRE